SESRTPRASSTCSGAAPLAASASRQRRANSASPRRTFIAPGVLQILSAPRDHLHGDQIEAAGGEDAEPPVRANKDLARLPPHRERVAADLDVAVEPSFRQAQLLRDAPAASSTAPSAAGG